MTCSLSGSCFSTLRRTEPFKLWLARVGYERMEETEDPEKASCGAEAYTLAILLSELSPDKWHNILAADIDDKMLAR